LATDKQNRCCAVWLLDIRTVSEAAVAFFEQRLSASETQRYANFVRPQRKRQFLLGRMLLRLAISDMINVPVHVISLVDRAGSAPELFIDSSRDLAANFSISHSGNWVGCVLSTDVVLGFDIEVNNPGRNILGLSEAAFHQQEHLWLLQQPDAERVTAFYRLWSTREALYKLMSSLGREMPSPSLVSIMNDLGSETCWYPRAAMHPSLTIVVCSDKRIAALTQIELTGLTPSDFFDKHQGVLPAIH
jgi:4'-phosphopantetheinyl transferase